MQTWLNINLSNISHNIKQIKKLIGKDKEIIAVVKSNAYGHGLVAVSKTAVEAGVKMLAVVNIEEALAIRRSGINTSVLILGKVEKKDIDSVIKNNIDLTIFDKYGLNDIIGVKSSLNVHLKCDTGMGRLGLMPNEVLAAAQKLRKNPDIKIKGVMTHFCCADLAKGDLIKNQIRVFARVLETLKKYHISPGIIHLENSAAVLKNTDRHKILTDEYGQIYIRPGIAIYGLTPFADSKNVIKLKPALEWKAKIIQVKSLPKGHCVSYGCDFKAKKPTKIAILPVGYYEGYDRGLSNRGEVLIKGKRSQVIGRVTMNYAMVDVTRIAGVRVGDEAVLIGKQGKEEITVNELAKKINTINYEILTGISPSVKRVCK